MILASVEMVTAVEPHPNADRLDLVTVFGWKAIVKRGEYSVGDLCVFVKPDTIVPICEWSEFLRPRSKDGKEVRINIMKLRGHHSAGLVLPTSVLPNDSIVQGVDVSSVLGIRKYVKELPAQLVGVAKGNFPTHRACKTDEDNGLNAIDFARKMLETEDDIVVTAKLDGSSITVVCDDGSITDVCSRNLSLEPSDTSSYWVAARKLRIPDGWTGVIQGELMGAGIQGNQLGLSEPQMFVFQIIDGKERANFMSYSQMFFFCHEKLGCETVPLLCTYSRRAEDGAKRLAELECVADNLKIVKRDGSGPTTGEGIVVRTASHRPHADYSRPMGFKLINKNYED